MEIATVFSELIAIWDIEICSVLEKSYFAWLKFGISNRLKKNWTSTVYAVISEAIKPLQLFDQAEELNFEYKFEPLQVIWQSLQRLFQKVIEGLEGKINCQALGAALWLCMRSSDGRAQTQGVSKSAAVAAGSDQLAWGKHPTRTYLSCNTDAVQESTRF